MKAFQCENYILQQAIPEILKTINAVAFNNLLFRKTFLSWKRGLQINYNITRLDEWCKSHNIPEGHEKLEHVLQASKLLQLHKRSIMDIDVVFDVCFSLS